MEQKTISLLGATGSIGTQTLDVARLCGFRVEALAAMRNISLLEAQAREFLPSLVEVFDEGAAKELKIKLADLPIRVVTGMEGLIEAATMAKADVVVNSVVGRIGLQPTLAAISAGKDIALANKETLVAGGELVMKAAKENGVKILPVDSEHSAIFQCLQGCPPSRALKKILLTASGGPFFGKTKAELEQVTPAQALKHPNWSMGAKLTIDSATMMNKGLEIIEAVWLFGLPQEAIEVVVHRESVIHSMIEFDDNSVIGQLGVPDMRIPIQYALTYPERIPSPVKELSLTDYGKLTFFAPDMETFDCLAACREAISRGGLVPAVANAANEKAVELFLKEKIRFTDIPVLVRAAMEAQKPAEVTGLEQILEADEAARAYVEGLAFGMGCA